jgi:hypothetical protein
MTAPDQIQITHRPRTMTMATIRAAQKAEPEGEGPTDEDLYDLAEQFNGDTVPAMRRALELWGNPLQGAPAPGENPAAQPAPVPVAWCRSDEFANSMNRGGSFNGWKDPGAGANKCDMQLYAIPLPAPVPVTECPHCGYEGEMVPVTQAGDVEA